MTEQGGLWLTLVTWRFSTSVPKTIRHQRRMGLKVFVT